MELEKENKYDTTRTVGNLQKFVGFFLGKSEVQKMKMKKENECDTKREFFSEVRKAENEDGKRK